MSNLLVMTAFAVISSTGVAKEQESVVPLVQPVVEINHNQKNLIAVNANVESALPNDVLVINNFNPKTIVAVENLSTSDHLEENLNLPTNDWVDMENDMELGFDTKAYLPENFDPYANPTDIHSINFIEEEGIELGFETSAYLPEGFNAYEAYFDVHALEFIEDEMEFIVEDLEACKIEKHSALNIHQ